MFYLLLFWLLTPLLFILNFFRTKPAGNLIIQTAKIGDYANTTVMLESLGKSDILLDAINAPFARHDSRIGTYFIANDYRLGLPKKLRLGMRLFWGNYQHVYVVMPNALNLFWANLAYSRHTTTLITYHSQYYIKWLAARMKTIQHTKEDLTIDSYLKMIDPRLNHTTIRKKIMEPLLIPKNSHILHPAHFKIGISIAAGNKIKTIEPETWGKIFGILRNLKCDIYVFGLPDEQPFLEALDTQGLCLISLLGKIPLEELPWYIAQMNLYLSSDTGNSYIADSLDVPLINFAGPCCMLEQRPVGEKVLIVESNAPCVPFSYIFNAPYEKKCEGLYLITDSQEKMIATFINRIYQVYGATKISPSEPPSNPL